MRKTRLLAVLCIALLVVFAYGCGKGAKEAETTEAGTHEQGEAGEHTHEGETAEHTHEGETAEHTHEGETEPHTHEGETAEHEHGEEGEESGPQIGLDGTHDEVRKGVRLILSFDSESSSFVGTVENVSEKTVSNVRIEVHLSNGVELGPTESVDLAPGKKIEVKLTAVDQTFTWWIAHAEAGTSEH
ncbi:FxLYD domain-containing protein [Acidobacteriota bacterium]